MSDELVKWLRDCGNDSVGCGGCPYKGRRRDGSCINGLLAEAADSIEELNKRNCELLFQVCQAEALIDYYQTGRMVSNEPSKEG